MTLSDVIHNSLQAFIRASGAPEEVEVTEVILSKRAFTVRMIINKSREKLWRLEEGFGLTESGKIVALVTDLNPVRDGHDRVLRDKDGSPITGWVVRPVQYLNNYETHLLTVLIESRCGQ